MITENLSTLKIHKLTQVQYDREVEAGRIDENALYLTPDEVIDLSGYATKSDLNSKANSSHIHDYAGKVVEGETFTVPDSIYDDGLESTIILAETGAEIFNNYNSNVATGIYSHAEGDGTEALGNYSHAEGNNSRANGEGSHAEGYYALADGAYSHAEGKETTASGIHSHAEGYFTTASDECSHAEGSGTIASGYCSHTEGLGTKASNSYSHAEGQDTIASGIASHAEGVKTTALNYQHAQGHYNNTTNAKAGTNSGTGTGTAFVIGNGTSSAGSNAFRVTYDGKPYSKSTMTTSGADYAEYFEWQDLNPNAEDRRGYFVTLDGDKIKIAKPNDYILGIVSGQPSVVGNGDEDWMGRYIFDDFGAFVYENFEYKEEVFEKVVDEKTGEVTIEKKIVTKTGKKYKENPDYDPTQNYIQREDRPEWDAIGLIGVLSVRDDGTCKVNGYCNVTSGGIATASETGYRVIKRVNDNIVKVIFR